MSKPEAESPPEETPEEPISIETEPEEQPKSKESPSQAAESKTVKTVKVRYDGLASKVRIAGYQFRPGEVQDVQKDHVEDFLTVPFERFTVLEE